MAINTATNFSVGANLPIDERQVVSSYADLASLLVYEGLLTYVKNEKCLYIYKDNSWVKYEQDINLDAYALKTEIPTKTSELTNDSSFATTDQLFSKDYSDLTNKPEIYNKSEIDGKLTKNNLISIIGTASETLSGVMSAEDKKHLNTIVELLQTDDNNFVDKISEVLEIFNQYPEGADLVSALALKADKSDLNNIDYDNLSNKPEKIMVIFREVVTDETAPALKEIEINNQVWRIVGETSSSGSGTSDYRDLQYKPSINDVVLNGNKTLNELGISSIDEIELESILN